MSDDETFEGFFQNPLMVYADILNKEIEEGNIEYKLKLINLNDEQITHRVTQLHWRLNESKESTVNSGIDLTCETAFTPKKSISESPSSSSSTSKTKNSITGGDDKDCAVYFIGVEDSGYPIGISKDELKESINSLLKIAAAANGELVIKSILKGHGSDNNYVAKVLVKRTCKKQIASHSQITVAIAGDFDSGKSTLIGVLSTGHHDNGKGSARMHIFQHNHELSSGRTSSIAQHNIYFDAQGNVLNNSISRSSSSVTSKTNKVSASKSSLLKNLTEAEMTDCASRIVSFLDLAGHIKYLKTTLYGLVARSPDNCLLCVSAKRGMQSMTSEHLGVIFALQLNLSIVITKADTTSSQGVDSLVSSLISMLTTKSRRLVRIDSVDHLKQLSPAVDSGNSSDLKNSSQHNGNSTEQLQTIIPIFVTSCVSGEGLDLLSHHFCFIQKSATNRENGHINISQNKVPISMKTVGDSFHLNDSVNNAKSLRLERKAFGRVIGSFKNRASDSGISSHSPGNEEDISSPANIERDHSRILSETVLLVVAHSANLVTNSVYYFGPFNVRGAFIRVRIKSVRVNNVPVEVALRGQTATITLASVVESNVADHAQVDTSNNSLVNQKHPHSSDFTLQHSESNDQTRNTQLTHSFSQLIQTDSTAVPSPTRLSPLMLRRGRSNSMPVLHCVDDTQDLDTKNCGSLVNQSDSRSDTSHRDTSNSPFASTDKSMGDLVPPHTSISITARTVTAAALPSDRRPRSISNLHSLSSAVKSKADADMGVDILNSSLLSSMNVNEMTNDSVGQCKQSAAATSSGHAIRSPYLKRRPLNGLVLLPLPPNESSPAAVVAAAAPPEGCWEFESEILVLNHESIGINYEPVIMVDAVEQSARLIAIHRLHPATCASHRTNQSSSDMKPNTVCKDTPSVSTAIDGEPTACSLAPHPIITLKTGSKAICHFRFLYHPEYLVEGSLLLMREGRTRGIGSVTKVFRYIFSQNHVELPPLNQNHNCNNIDITQVAIDKGRADD